jgi:hypothetical protein
VKPRISALGGPCRYAWSRFSKRGLSRNTIRERRDHPALNSRGIALEQRSNSLLPKGWSRHGRRCIRPGVHFRQDELPHARRLGGDTGRPTASLQTLDLSTVFDVRAKGKSLIVRGEQSCCLFVSRPLGPLVHFFHPRPALSPTRNGGPVVPRARKGASLAVHRANQSHQPHRPDLPPRSVQLHAGAVRESARELRPMASPMRSTGCCKTWP